MEKRYNFSDKSYKWNYIIAFIEREKNPVEIQMVFELLNEYNKDEKHSMPSVRTLCKKMNCHTQLIQKTINNLEEKGYIKIEKIIGKTGFYELTPYDIIEKKFIKSIYF